MRIDPKSPRGMVVSPVEGGSLPVARHAYEALCSLGHDVFFADLSFLDAGASFGNASGDAEVREALIEHASKLVLKKARELEPEICIVLAQAPLSPDCIETLRKDGVTTVYWFVENYRLTRYWEWLAPLYDYFFTVQKGPFHEELDRIGCDRERVHWLPLACSPARHRSARLSASERRELSCDVSFAGYGYYNRRKAFTALLGLDFGIWGPGWEGSRVASLVRSGDVFSEKTFLKIAAASKVNVNLHSATHVPGVDPDGDYLNPRVFELAACGAFQLSDRRSHLTEMFTEGEEIVTFTDASELRSLVEHYLAHAAERTKIAAAARKRVRTEHTYERRMQMVLDVVFGGASRMPHRVESTIEVRLSELGGLSGLPVVNETTLVEKLTELESDTRASDEEILLRIALAHRGGNL